MNTLTATAGSARESNKDLLIPYVAPYLAFVAIASLLGGYLTFEWNYVLRLLFVVPLLIFYWRSYVPLRGPKSPLISGLAGAFTGILGTVMWVVLVKPFAPSEGVHWSQAGLGLRLATAGLVVPVFEELLMRGYVLRLVLQWDLLRKAGAEDAFGKAFHDSSIEQVEAGSWTLAAVVISTVVFALGHQVREWPAALAYGLLMAALWINRKDLLSCVVAHGVTNIALTLYIWNTKQWGIW